MSSELVEISQQLSVYQNDEDFVMDNPLLQDESTVPPVEESKEPPKVLGDLSRKANEDDSRSPASSARVQEDLSTIIRNAPETPVFSRKGRGASHVEDRRDSVFVRNLTGKDGDQALKIKYHEKALRSRSIYRR